MHQLIEESIKDCYRKIENLRKLEPSIELLEEIKSIFGKDFKNHLSEDSDGMIIGIDDVLDYPNALLYVCVHHLKEVVPIIKYLYSKGFKKFGYPSDNPHGKKRTYSFKNREYASYPYIEITAVLPDVGAKCEYAKTGTREVDIYELRCNGEPYIDEKIKGKNGFNATINSII